MSSDAATEIRPLRADARRNRERVLNAARDAFAEQGLEAQMDDIAARAGVGVGTVYRHFPTKDALLRGLVADRFDRLRAAAEPWFEVDDAWEALSGFLWECARMQCGNRGWAQVQAATHAVIGEVEEERDALQAVTGKLLERAQAAGQARSDATAHDVAMLMCGTCGVIEMTGGHSGDDRWERFFALALEGLRARS